MDAYTSAIVQLENVFRRRVYFMTTIDSIKARSERRHDSSFTRYVNMVLFAWNERERYVVIPSVDRPLSFVRRGFRDWLKFLQVLKLRRSALLSGRVCERGNPWRVTCRRSRIIRAYFFRVSSIALRASRTRVILHFAAHATVTTAAKAYLEFLRMRAKPIALTSSSRPARGVLASIIVQYNVYDEQSCAKTLSVKHAD